MTSLAGRADVTRILAKLREGDDDHLEELFNRIYPELRRRARGQRRRWTGKPSLQTTALAHEAYLKLVGQSERSWETRSHFLAVASRAMRQILLNEARRNRADKRGGGAPKLSLEKLRESLDREAATAEERAEGLVVLDQALDQLEEEHERAARVVECRFFSGMTIDQTAEALGVSSSTVSRDWELAQAWLYRRMRQIWKGKSPDANGASRD